MRSSLAQGALPSAHAAVASIKPSNTPTEIHYGIAINWFFPRNITAARPECFARSDAALVGGGLPLTKSRRRES
jgi:hypothetical protein